MAILDSRLVTSGYGKQIMRALPPAPRIDSVRQAEEFFAGQ
jgi:Rad3-related DNA helicase